MRIMLNQSDVTRSGALPGFRATYRPAQPMSGTQTPRSTSWTAEMEELFVERAAALEYDGGLPRDEAEQAALADVHRAFGMGTPASTHAVPAGAAGDDGLEDVFGPLVSPPPVAHDALTRRVVC